MTVVTINPGDGGGDDAAFINAALQDPSVTTVILGPGVFLLNSSIDVPSGKSLVGQGQGVTVLQAQEGFVRNEAESDAVVNSEWGATDVTLSDFSIDANKLYPDGQRLLGCYMRRAEDFSITNVDVHNSTGYAHHAYQASGEYEGCYTYNSSVHFEQMDCDGITLTDCHARDGDGDIEAESHFHPLIGSKNITYIDCTGYSSAGGGFGLAPGVRPLENITIINCEIEVGIRPALVALTFLPVINLQIVGSSFISHGGIGARLGGVSGTAVDSYFQGDVMGINFSYSGDGTAPNFVATDSDTLGLRDPAGGGAAYGIASGGGYVLWDGGTIAGRGALSFAFGSSNISVTSATSFSYGFDAQMTFVENSATARIAASLPAPDGTFGSFDGGSLEVDVVSQGFAEDRLGIAHQGTGEGQIGVSGSQISFGGTVIGTFAGGASGGALIVTFGPAATPEAVLATARAVTFSNGSDNPALPARYFDFIFTDGAGATATSNTAVIVKPVNDVPAIDLDGGPGHPSPLAYTEGDPAVAVAPQASLSDVDSTNFAGGKLVAQISANAEAADRLAISHQGTGAGEIGLSGTAVLYGGRQIGTFSGGEGGSPLVISLDGAATPEAAQALLRSIVYRHLSTAPAGGTKTVTFTVDDGDGAAVLASAVRAIEVTPVDQLAVARDDAAVTDEDNAVTFSVTANDDIDGGPSPPVLAEVAGVAVVPGQVVVLPSGARITVGAIGTLSYDPAGRFETLASGSSASDSFTYRLTNGTTATVSVQINGVNEAPVVDLNGGSAGTGSTVAYVENATPVALAYVASVSDRDSAVLNGGTLQVAFVSGGTADDRLSVINEGGGAFKVGVSGGNVSYGGVVIGTVSGGEGGSPLVISFNDKATPHAVTMVTRRIAYDSSSDNPSTAQRSVSFTVTDGTGRSSSPAFATVNLRAVDDAARARDDAAETYENRTTSFSVTANDDIDGGPSPPQLAQVAGVSAVVGQTVTLPSGARVTVQADGMLSYNPAGSFNSLAWGASALDSFTYGLSNGTSATVTVTVRGLSDAPIVDLNGAGAGTGSTANYTENGAPVAVAFGASVSDRDSAVLNGGTLQVAFASGATADDRLSVINEGGGAFKVGVSGGIVSYGGVVIGTVSGGEGGSPLVISFNDKATPHAVTMVTRRIAYDSSSDNPPAQRSISFTITDGMGGSSTPVIATVSVRSVDDPAEAFADASSTDEASVVSIAVAANDRDIDGPTPTVSHVAGIAVAAGQTVTLASGARVTLSPSGALAYDPNGAFNHLADPASGAADTAGTDSFSYTLRNGNSATVTVVIEGRASAGDRLVGTSGNDTLFGSGADDMFRLQHGGDDQATGGGGSDSFYLGGALTGADVISGGGGSDVLILQGGYGNGLALSANLSGVEALLLLSGADRTYGDLGGSRYSYWITAGDAAFSAPEGGGRIEIDGSSLLDIEILTFDGSQETDAGFTIRGGAGNDTITGGGGADVIHGGGGTDRLWGGGGDDLFVYVSAGESPAGPADRILDFAAGDRIDLSSFDADPAQEGRQSFSLIGANGFSRTAGQLHVSQQGDGSWRISGDLDGNGIGDFSIIVTTVGGHALGAGDFLF